MQEHQPMEAVHADDREWETLRWPGQWSKMLFHPRAERPTEPNAGHSNFVAWLRPADTAFLAVFPAPPGQLCWQAAPLVYAC